jgi:hypothetical protein
MNHPRLIKNTFNGSKNASLTQDGDTYIFTVSTHPQGCKSPFGITIASHSLSVAHTDDDRLQAHWDGFLTGNGFTTVAQRAAS